MLKEEFEKGVTKKHFFQIFVNIKNIKKIAKNIKNKSFVFTAWIDLSIYPSIDLSIAIDQSID